MKIVGRLVATKYVKTLKKPDASQAELDEARVKLIERGAASVPSLLELMKDRDAAPHALSILAELVDDECLPILRAALDDEDAAIANAATTVLSESEAYDPTPLVDALADGGMARPRIEAILEARGAALPLRKLLPALTDEENDSRELVFRLIQSHGDPSIIPHVRRLLESDSTWVRSHAVRLLGQFDTDGAISGVVQAVRDPDPAVRLVAVRTLEKVATPSGIPELANALRDGDLKVHAAAIDALTAIGDVSAVPHLVEVLKDESEYARRGAVEVLNEVATTEAIKDLVSALRDADWWVRVRAADALGSLGGERVVEALLQLLETGDDFIRRYAVEILITVHDARAVEPLIRRLKDEDWWVRERAIDALAKIRDARAVEPLIDTMLVDPDAAPLCARALGELADERAVEPLCRVATSGPVEHAQEAVGALQKLARQELPQARHAQIREALAVAGIKGGESQMAPMPVQPAGPARGAGPPDSRGMVPHGPRSPEARRVDPTLRVGDSMVMGGHREPSGAAPAPSPAPAHQPAPVEKKPVDVRTLGPGQVLGDRYEVIRKIGSGGFGSVFLVEDKTIGDEMILKILSPHICQDETMIKRFVHELKYTRRITHRHVIRLFDFVELDGVHAISMEFFDGQDLAKRLRAEKAFEPSKMLAIAAQICKGLTAAHEEGIIHRDIKPPNVLVDSNDVVKIVDFGLASVAQGHAGSQLTRSGIIIGTPQYMAPEQITGDTTDARTDIYALGVVMYEMLTGAQPFTGENAVNILFQHLEGEARPIQELAPNVPDEVVQLVKTAMAKEREARPESAAELLETIRRLEPETVDE